MRKCLVLADIYILTGHTVLEVYEHGTASAQLLLVSEDVGLLLGQQMAGCQVGSGGVEKNTSAKVRRSSCLVTQQLILWI